MTAVLFGPQSMWFLTRASGLVLLVLLTATVVLGVLGPIRFRLRHWPSFLTTAVHRDISLLTVALLAIHVVTTVADGYAPVRWRDAVVPFVSAYRPLWLGLGALALDLVLALVVTSMLRGRIGLRTWRTLHYLAYVSWPVALMHGFGTGTDVRRPAMQLLAAACGFAVIGAVSVRLVGGSVRSTRARAWGALAALVGPAAFAGWAVSGPLAPGWAAKAGTPAPKASLAAELASLDRPTYSPPLFANAASMRLPVRARVDGAVSRTQLPGGLTRLDLTGMVSDGASGSIRIVVDGRSHLGDGLTANRGGVSLGPPGAPTRWRGGVVNLAADTFSLRLWDSAKQRVDATLRIALSSDGSRFAGVLTATTYRPPPPAPAVVVIAPPAPRPAPAQTTVRAPAPQPVAPAPAYVAPAGGEHEGGGDD